jgi:hypothetical protein
LEKLFSDARRTFTFASASYVHGKRATPTPPRVRS